MNLTRVLIDAFAAHRSYSLTAEQHTDDARRAWREGDARTAVYNELQASMAHALAHEEIVKIAKELGR